MAEQQDDRGKPGPLGELLPGLFRREQRLMRALVHPRATRLEDEHGRARVILGSFGDQGDARELHRGLRAILEAALLHELSLARDAVRTTRLGSVELYSFCKWPFDAAPALSPFALHPVTLDPAELRAPLSLLRGEARLVEGAQAEEPSQVFRALGPRQPPPLALEIEQELRENAPQGPWGSEPGKLARLLASGLAQRGVRGIEPTKRGVELAEQALVPREHAVIRWIPPLCFQALCDLVAVMAHDLADEVEWGVSDPDEDSGLAPPPVLRVETAHGRGHVPLGEHVLRWCIMPLVQGEIAPSLGAWAEHEFAP